MSAITASPINPKLRLEKWKGPATTATLACLFSAVLLGAPVELKRIGDQIDVFIEGQPFTTYLSSDVVAKPYLMPLRSARGVVLTRSFPKVNTVTDANQHTPSFEPHQRGLYFAHGDIDGLNFWAEQAFEKYYHGHSRQAYGRMALVRVENVSNGPDVG